MKIRSITPKGNTLPRATAANESPFFASTPDEVRTPLQKKAARVTAAKSYARGLAAVTQNQQMKKAYTATLRDCNTTLQQTGGKLATTHCKNRWCAACNAYRAACVWQNYGAELQQWHDAYLVTLTIPNVTGIELRSALTTMHKRFTLCWRSLRERHHRALQLIRATEVTANVKERTYHPHLHVIVKGHAEAKALYKAWMKRYPQAAAIAQDIRKANGNSLNELVKYVAKTSNATKREDGTLEVVPFKMLDTIYTALRGLRLLACVGVNKATPDDAEDALDDSGEDVALTATKRPAENIRWEWSQSLRDWLDYTTGETLSDYTPNAKEKDWFATLDDELRRTPTAPRSRSLRELLRERPHAPTAVALSA